LNAPQRRRARSRLLQSRRRTGCPAPYGGAARAVRAGVWIAAGAWRFRSVAMRREKSDREVPFHVFLRRPTPSTAHSSTADRRRAGRRRAQRFWTTIPHAYRMHVQREFLISSAVSDLWVCWAGRAHAAASTRIETIAPSRASSKGDPMKLSRTVGVAVAISLPRFLPPPTRRIAP